MPTPRNTPKTEPVPGAVGFPGDEDYAAGDWRDADAFSAPVVPGAKFEEIGTTVTGVVVDATISAQTDIDGNVRVFDSGEIRQQLVITLQTNEHDDEDDDGLRKIFVKSFMVKPFRNEMKRNKVPGVRPGGELTVTYVADGEVTKKGYSAPKLFEVSYVAP